MAKDQPLETSGEIKKSFHNKKNNVTLDFTLRIDIKQEMKDFLECLAAATRQVQEELAKLK